MSSKQYNSQEFKRAIDLGRINTIEATDLLRIWRVGGGDEKAIRLVDLTNAITSGTQIFVPYSGAIQNVDLGEFGLKAGYLALDTTPTNTPTAQGTMYWDVDDNTVAMIMNGTIQKIGEDSFYPVKNQTGSNIPRGTAVRFAGTLGMSGRLLIAPFLANGSFPSITFMGVTSEDIANGEDGKVQWFGRIRGINTNAFNQGDILYASPTVAGGFTTTPPQAPNNIISVCAVITKSTTVGTIFVRPQIGSNINNDEGVKIVSPITGNLLQLQSNGLWENKTLAQVLGGNANQFVKGNGTLDSTLYVPTTRTLTINETVFDLSDDRSWTIPTHDPVTIGTANGLSLSGQAISLGLSSSSTTGALSSTDWNTFNGKIGGSLTANYVPRASNANTLVNSIIREENGALIIEGNVTINGFTYSSNFIKNGSGGTGGTGGTGGVISWENIQDKPTIFPTNWDNVANKPTTFAPSAHIHGNISNTGAIGTTAGLPIITTTSGVLTTGLFGTTAGTFAQGNDNRITNGQTAFGWGDHRAYNVTSNALGGGYISGGLEKPNWAGFGAGKLKLQMLRADNNVGVSGLTWADVLWLSSYVGSDVKGSNALILGKTSEFIGFARQNYDSATWGTVRTIWHSGNLPNPIQGTIASGQVAFGNASGAIVGDNGLVWDNVNKRLGIGITNPNEILHLNTTRPYIHFTSATTGTTSNDGTFIGFRDTNGEFEIRNKENQPIVLITNEIDRWRITGTGILQSNGAQTIRTSTGNLTLATAGGNGNIILSPNGSGNVFINTTTALTGGGRLQVNGDVNIATVANATGDFLTHTNGLVNKRTASQVRTDIGAIAGTIGNTQVAFGNSAGAIVGDSGLVWDNTVKRLDLLGSNSSLVRVRGNTNGGAFFVTQVNSNSTAIGFGNSLAITGSGSTNMLFSNTIFDLYVNGSTRWSILSTGILQSNGTQIIRTSTGDLRLETGGGNGNIILSPNGLGNVGIGTTAPTELLDVVGSGAAKAIKISTTTNNASFIEASANNGTVRTRLQSNPDIAFIGTLTNHPLIFQVNNTERMRITSTGNVGIGTTNPNLRLFVRDDINGEGGLRIRNANSGTGATAMFRMNNNLTGDGDSQVLMFLNSSTRTADGGINTFTIRNNIGDIRVSSASGGNVLFMTSSTDERMRIVSNGRILINSTSDNGVGQLQVNGNITATNFIKSSDFRLKSEIMPITNWHEAIMNIEGKSYVKNDRKELGFIAQDVEKYFPELITYDNKGFLSMDYDGMIPVLWNAVREEMSELDKLKLRVSQLENEIQKLKNVT